MKRFLILVLILIFSIGAVSAEDVNLTNDDCAAVNGDHDSLTHWMQNENIDTSSNFSEISDNGQLIGDETDWTLFSDNSSSKWFDDVYTDLRNNLGNDYSRLLDKTIKDLKNNSDVNYPAISSAGTIIDNRWNSNVPVFNNPDELYDLLIKSNDLKICYVYLAEFLRLDNVLHQYGDYMTKIEDAIAYIVNANTNAYVDKFYSDLDAYIESIYPSSNPCYNNSNRWVLPMIASHDIVKYYGEKIPFEAMLLGKDSSNDTKMASFIINGRTYNRIIDENRTSRININLGPGVYNITTVNPFNGQEKTNKITVLSLVESNDLIKYYRNDSQFIVKIFNATGGNVTFNINGVFYTRMISETGHAKLNINLVPGEYIITTDYNGCRAANNITVLTIMSADDLEMKYRDGSKFTVRVRDGQGRILANAAVTFNVNGVFYERISDANGEARLNINLMAGEYIITSTYNALNVSNKITISA